MKRILENIYFIVIVTVILVFFTVVYGYNEWYKPHQKQYKTEVLSKVLYQNGYNTDIVKSLLNEIPTDVHFFDIHKLKVNADSVFTYYTNDDYKVTYTLTFIGYRKFYDYNMNTRMNILTNIYKSCTEYFQYQYNIDSIAFETDGVLVKNEIKFLRSLTDCIRNHINDNNNDIFNVQYINQNLFEGSDGELGKLGSLLLSSFDFHVQKLSGDEIKDLEIREKIKEEAKFLLNRYKSSHQKYNDKFNELEKINKKDFNIYGNFIFPGESSFNYIFRK